MAIDPSKFNKPLFGTQGGGFVERVGKDEVYRFVEAPSNFPMFQVGSTMPKEWYIAPANDAARRLIDEDRSGISAIALEGQLDDPIDQIERDQRVVDDYLRRSLRF